MDEEKAPCASTLALKAREAGTGDLVCAQDDGVRLHAEAHLGAVTSVDPERLRADAGDRVPLAIGGIDLGDAIAGTKLGL